MDAGLPDDRAHRAALDELAAPHVLARALASVERPPAPPPPALGSPAGGWLTGVWSDVRYAIRALRGSPALSTIALLTLGIGIGANAAIFSVVNAAILRPLPFAQPDRLVSFWGSAPQMGLPVVRYVYVPHAQRPAAEMDLVVRTKVEPASMAAAIRREIRRMDSTLPFYQVHTLDQAVAQSLGTRRLTNNLLLAFAAAALLLAVIGIYGVMALGVSQRVHEFGIRLALGARPRDVLALVVGQGMRLVLLGVALGLAGAAAVTRYLGTLLFGVEPLDPLIFAGVTVVLVAVALAACLIPARRATATPPLEALRQG